MLWYQKIDVSEGIDVNKTSASKKCKLFSLLVFERYWVYVCNKCHDLLTIAYSLKDLGCFLHNLKILIQKIIVVLWILNSLTSLTNFSFSLNFLKTCLWWYATFIIPLFFILIISWYRLIISAALSESCTSSASLFRS